MAYTNIANVRLISNLETADISDADVTSLISKATAILNGDINTPVVRERVDYIDRTRKNEINGSNTTFYVRNWRGKFIGDSDDDGDVDNSDITVNQVAADGTETTLTVSSVTSSEGKFVLSSAPTSGVRLYVTYDWVYKDPTTPSTLIEQACSNLIVALSFEKINRGLSPSQVFGNTRLSRDMKAGSEFYKSYLGLVDKINTSSSVSYTEASIF